MVSLAKCGRLLTKTKILGEHFLVLKDLLHYSYPSYLRASPGAAVKLCLGDLLVMGSNPETVSLHMQG